LHKALHSPQCEGHPEGKLLPYRAWETPEGNLKFDTEDEAEYPFGFCQAYARAVAHAFKEWNALSIPVGLSDRPEWIESVMLHNATKRLGQSGVAEAIWPILKGLLKSMTPGNESNHLKLLLSRGDFRGSDVLLSSQVLVSGSRQLAPYPAFAWAWKSVQSYKWAQSQHINVLEFIALFNYIRSIVTSSRIHSHRLFHVLDSRVSSCIVAKGRSSRLLNRCCRRFAAFTLAADIYVLPLWTISKWNFSDAASRHLPEDD
jgi:hypothetical protein